MEATFAAAAEEVGSQSSGVRRARIVLADDNADMREYLSRLLRERWDVEAASNGAAALAALRGSPTDLDLADVMMPVMDGFELLRNIRSDTALRLMPVLLLSARAGDEATSEGLNAGADDYIVKPFAARDLLVRVASKLAVAGLANETRAVEEAARKRSEASERQFRELVENLPELSWTARPDGFIDYYNRRWFEYTGASVEQVQGWSWISLVDPGYVEPVMNRGRHSIATGEPFEMEFPLRGADGEFRWFMTRVRPLHDSAGRIIRWFGSNTNIDERRRHDDFRDTFLGILGHDLRNPLNTILMTSRLLEARAGTRQTQEIAQRVTRSGIRMQRMIEQLLDLTRARLTAGIPVTLSSEAVDVGALVAGIVDETRAARPQASIDLSVDGDCAARIDADRFEQVVSNLLDNAVTHGEQGKPIRVEVVSKTNTVCLSVQNYGPPIDPAFLPLIFSPFARCETARQSSSGLGLGQYVSERIIAAHDGKLSVHSAPQTGTRFEAVIPRQPPGR